MLQFQEKFKGLKDISSANPEKIFNLWSERETYLVLGSEGYVMTYCYVFMTVIIILKNSFRSLF